MPQLSLSLRKMLKEPSFLVVTVILLISAASLSATANYLKLHFRKQAVPLNKSLAELPPTLGPWLQVSIDGGLPHDIQEALGTDKYIFRDYVDTRQLSREELDQFKDKSGQERKRLLTMLQFEKPKAVVNLGMTYYTGLVDTVAHIPERCYIADGYEPTKSDDTVWSALQDRPGSKMVRSITFEDATAGRRSVRRNVAYFFNCNGEYLNDSIAVRKRLANLFERHGYYMKVEIQTLNLPPEEAAVIMNDFLTHALPRAEDSLPNWASFSAAR